MNRQCLHMLLVFMTSVISFGWKPIEQESQKMSGIVVHTFTKNFTNVYFIEKDGRYLMIDSGLPRDREKILAFAEKKRIDLTKIEYLILTHAHADHAGNAAFLQTKYGIKVIAGSSDVEMINQHGKDPYLCPRGLIGNILKGSVDRRHYESFLPEILVDKEMDLNSIGWEGRLASYSSHTAGSLTVFINQFVFVGDLIKGKNLRKKKPALHIFMCDLIHNIQDIEAITHQKNIDTWYVGHGGPLKSHQVYRLLNQKKKKHE